MIFINACNKMGMIDEAEARVQMRQLAVRIAQGTSERRVDREGQPMRLNIYQCDQCGYWHIGNRKRRWVETAAQVEGRA